MLLTFLNILNLETNILAAIVSNGGKDKPLSFISVQTAFMLRSEDAQYAFINTNPTWKVFRNNAYKVISYDEMLFKNRWFYGFYACGGGDEVFGERYPWGWEKQDFNDEHWKSSEVLQFEGNSPWNLVPRNIPFMDNYIEYPVKIRQVTGLDIKPGFWNGSSKLYIPSESKVSLIVDFGKLTMGYPELMLNGGAKSSIKIKYAEALYEKVNLKAHRDSVDGKTMFGVWDIFHTDGKNQRIFRPLWKRAFRYVNLIIETGVEPLEIVSFQNEYSGYPYHSMATFRCDDQKLNEIFDMCLRTLRMCSGETYYDTPFYEQLSYGGDNRPITSISTYNSTDDRLLREVLRLYPQSENNETGLFKSAYPSRSDKDMGTWSFAWIQTLQDYYFMRGDSTYAVQYVNNIERILGFYQRHLDEKSGLIGTVRNRNFIDWSIAKGSIPKANDQMEIKQSALLSFYYIHTLDCSVRLFNEIGEIEKGKKWAQLAGDMKIAVVENCWDEQMQLFRDYPDQQIYSQHTNLLAILCDAVIPARQKELMNRILTFDKFDEMASSYFSFFLFKALQKTDQEDLLLKHLDFWNNFVERGHTTCGETGFDSHDRSDCHAWSAHPAYFLLSSVCGIMPADIGFNKVRITPHLGKLNTVKASMPHPKGLISVDYKMVKGKLMALINLPKTMSGVWEYIGQKIELKEGQNKINY